MQIPLGKGNRDFVLAEGRIDREIKLTADDELILRATNPDQQFKIQR